MQTASGTSISRSAPCLFKLLVTGKPTVLKPHICTTLHNGCGRYVTEVNIASGMDA